MKVIITQEQYNKILKESKWYNTFGDILGIFDPTGVVDLINGISYFNQGDHLFAMLSFISAFPYVGDVVAKPVMGALKIGSTATKELKVAMELSKAGKTLEASEKLAKLAKEPGAVGNFLRKAESWSPKIAERVENLPGGLLKGFKNTILDYLKLFERAGAKSAKFASEAGKLAKDVTITQAKQIQNIKALQDILKTEKIFDAAALTKKGLFSQIFTGGAPRLFGNRRLRILMRNTKFWLGFLDWAGIGNFVGPEEVMSKMSEDEFNKKMEEYMKTSQAKTYAAEDFGDEKVQQVMAQNQTQTPVIIQQPKDDGGIDMGKLLGGALGFDIGNLAMAAL